MEEKKETYVIPRNHTSFFSMGEMVKPRNTFEAIIVTLLVCKLISLVPFVREIKIGATVVLGLSCFIVFFVGYNDESITSFLYGYAKFKLYSGIRRIRIPAKKKEQQEQVQSNYEKLINRFKRREN